MNYFEHVKFTTLTSKRESILTEFTRAYETTNYLEIPECSEKRGEV
jgi:hypothetical protein